MKKRNYLINLRKISRFLSKLEKRNNVMAIIFLINVNIFNESTY